MFLEKLTVYSHKRSRIIREIEFKTKGLNLIVDNTPLSINSKIDETGNSQTGNNVGKTTFLRCIDFCLGSDGGDIYKGNNKQNQGKLVHDFLVNQEVVFELSCYSVDGVSTSIRRSFIQELDLFIDDTKYPKLDYFKEALNSLFFNIKSQDKVSSFRNMIKKFVRIDHQSQSDEFKVIVSGMSHNIEAIFLYLFGFPDIDLLSKMVSFKSELKDVQKKLKVFRGQFNIASLKASIVQLEKNIENSEYSVKNFDLPASYDELQSEYRKIKEITTTLSSKLGSINTKLMLSENNLADLKESESKIDPKAVEMLYKDAARIIPDIQKTFEEVLDFHNKMVKNKIQLVEIHIERLKSEKDNIQSILNEHLKEQNRILKLINENGGFDDLLVIREKLNGFQKELGVMKGKVEVVESLIKREKDLKKNIEEAQNLSSDYFAQMVKNIQNSFNEYFSKYTNSLYNTDTYVYYDEQNSKFQIDHLGESPSDGYQKARIIVFDLAFLGYFNDLSLYFPRFTIQDKVELIHVNQLKTIFEICSNINGQLIIPVLRERIAVLGDEFIDNHKILELSQDHKFFDIENFD